MMILETRISKLCRSHFIPIGHILFDAMMGEVLEVTAEQQLYEGETCYHNGCVAIMLRVDTKCGISTGGLYSAVDPQACT